MKIVPISEKRVEANEKVIAALKRMLNLAESGALLNMVILYDGSSDAEFGYAEFGDWDEARAVFHAEQWKASVMANKVKEPSR